MTRPLYHESADLNFQSVVEELQDSEICLAASAFYPESGGQASDIGTLTWADQQLRVLHTRKDKATGQIWHQIETDQTLPKIGSNITGQIDPSTRWRQTQRHSAEHLLAQAFKRINPVFEVAAVSMLGPECHIDFTGDPAPKHIQEAETLLREILGRDELTLETPQVKEQDLKQYPLRRESKVQGLIRLVIFKHAHGEYFDVSACGGTHVPRAAMCGPVVILRNERIKEGIVRVTFRAGEEASQYLSGLYRQSHTLAQTFSAAVDQLPKRIQALREEQQTTKLQLTQLRKQLAEQLIKQQTPTTIAGIPIRQFISDDLALLMPMLTSVPAGEVLIVAHPDGRCGISSQHPQINANQILKAAFDVLGGKGGGKPDLAQGTSEQADQLATTVLAHLKQTTCKHS